MDLKLMNTLVRCTMVFMVTFLFQFGTMATRSDLKKKMSEWAFAADQMLITLPMDGEKRNFIRRDNPNVVFSETYPTPFQNKAQLVCVR